MTEAEFADLAARVAALEAAEGGAPKAVLIMRRMAVTLSIAAGHAGEVMDILNRAIDSIDGPAEGCGPGGDVSLIAPRPARSQPR
jgi:hypothetical protein